MNDDASRRKVWTVRDLSILGAFLALSLVVSGLGGWATSTSVGDWYQDLQKPSFTPPDWIFAPVWTTLYVLIAVAGWRAWLRTPSARRAALFIPYGAQFGLNLAWSVLFFGLRSTGGALIEILFLLVAIAWTAIRFWRTDRLAGALLVPYLIWVSFAALLNGSLWLLN